MTAPSPSHSERLATDAIAQLRFDGYAHQALNLPAASLIPAAAALIDGGRSVAALLSTGELPGTVSEAAWYRFRTQLRFVSKMLDGAKLLDWHAPRRYAFPAFDSHPVRVALMVVRRIENRLDDLTPALLGRLARILAADIGADRPAACLDLLTGDNPGDLNLNNFRGFHAAVLQQIAGASRTHPHPREHPSPPAN